MKNALKYSLGLFIFLLFASFSWVHNSKLDENSSLEIHHIGVGQGDATLFIFTLDNGRKFNILLDTGNSNGKGTQIFEYLKNHLSLDEKDKYTIHALITSHLHSDHYGGAPTLINTLRTNANNWNLERIIDRAAEGTYMYDGQEVLCYDKNDEDMYFQNDDEEPEEAYQEPKTALYTRYQNAINDYNNTEGLNSIRVKLGVGMDLFTDVFRVQSPFKFWCLTLDTKVVKKIGELGAESPGDAESENDLSYSWLIQYEGFKYFTGGDIAGYNQSGYLDLETPLCDTFRESWSDYGSYHLCGFKVSHHGSSHSTNSLFINEECGNPTMAIIPSALRSFSGTQIPTEQTLTRIYNAVPDSTRNVMYTYIKDSINTNLADRYSSGKVIEYNHVVVTVTNPGFGKPIDMKIQQEKVNKKNLENVGAWGGKTISCAKEHNKEKE